MMAKDTTNPEIKSFTSAKLDWIDRIISDQRLTDYQKVVGVALSFYFNAETADCFVSQKKLAARVGGKRRATQNALDALADTGHIAVQIGSGRNSTNKYRMLNAAPTDSTVATCAPPCAPPASKPKAPAHPDAHPLRTEMRTPRAPPCAQTPLLNTPKNTCAEESTSTIDHQIELPSGMKLPMTIEIQTDNAITAPNDFKTFWMHYPKKVEKAAAAKAYARIIKFKQATETELLAGVIRYAAERAHQDSKFTKHAATWLNKGCWADEPQLTSQSRKVSRADSAIAGMRAFLEEGYYGNE
jgi:hypothetical protein